MLTLSEDDLTQLLIDIRVARACIEQGHLELADVALEQLAWLLCAAGCMAQKEQRSCLSIQ